MKNYRCPNGRVISRSSNGRFRTTTLEDFGFTKKDINTTKRLYCPKCKKTIMPITHSHNRYCYKCNSYMIWK